MGERVFEMRVLCQQVQRRNDVPRANGAYQQCRGGSTVGQHERDDFAGRNAGTGEESAERTAGLAQFRVADDRGGFGGE
jgi:hypothetical protein